MTSAYNALIPQAVAAANKPLQTYNGNLVAPLQATQNQAIAGIQGAVNSAQPGIATAQGLAAGSAAPINPQQYSAAAVDQYMNPYVNDVVNATQRQFQQGNAIQQSQLQGNAASQGALGGDRNAILQATLAGQQDLAQAPTIAGLYNTGFQGAQNEFNNQQGVGLQAAQANASNQLNAANVTGNLALAGQNSALTGNSALLNAGGLQQQVAQEQLNVPYEQYLQQQAYPYQNINFLSGILGGAAGATGATTTSSGTSSSSTPISIAKDGGRVGLASGGFSAPTAPSYFEREASRGVMNDTYHPGGLIESDVAGRTDRVPHAVAADSFVMPADVVSSIGQGNTLAGAKILDAIMSSGPFGTTLPRGGHLHGNTLAHGGRAHLAGGDAVPFDWGNGGDYSDPFQNANDVTVPVPASAGTNVIRPGQFLMPSAGMAAAANDSIAPDLPHRQRPPTGLAANDSLAYQPQPVAASDVAGGTGAPAVPTWGDNGQPVSTSALAAASDSGGMRPLSAYKPPSEDWGRTALAGLGSALAHRSIGAGILGGIQDYDAQRDIDSHPIVDDSGPTTKIYYKSANEWFDTGMPTNKSIENQNTADKTKAELALKGSEDAATEAYRQGDLTAKQRALDLQKQRLNLEYNPFGAAGNSDTSGGGVPLSDFAARMNAAENSSGDPSKTNPNSTATGNGQFVQGTWLGLMKSQHPDLVKGMSDQQILGLRADPALSNIATQDYAKQNAAALTQAGIPLTTASLAAAHRFGPADATKVLQADPNTPLTSILSKEVIAANPDMARATAGSYLNGLQSKVGNDPVNLGGAPQARPAGASAAVTAPAPIQAPGGSQLPVPAPKSVPPGQAADGAHGAAYLGTLQPNIAATVKALSEGRMAFPSGFALKSPYWQNMMLAVAQYDPSFDAVNYNARAATRRDFSSMSGKGGGSLASFNTAMGHLGNLDSHIDALNNGNYPDLNTMENWASTHGGDTRYQVALQRFETDRQAVSDELTRAFRMSGGNVHDIQGWESKLDAAQSPQALHAAVGEAVNLLKTRIDAVGDQYNRGMGTTADSLQLLSPKAQETYRKLVGDKSGTPANQNAPVVKTQKDFDALPAGAVYTGSDGKQYRKPKKAA